MAASLHIPGIPRISPSTLPPPALCFISPPTQQALPGNTQAAPAKDADRLTVSPPLPSLPFLQVQSSSLFPSSRAELLLCPFLTPCPHSSGTKQTVVGHPSFLPPVMLLHRLQSIPIPKPQVPVLRNTFYPESPVATPIKTPEKFPTGNTQSPHSP